LSLCFLVLVIQWLCVLYWEEFLFHPYHCLINWTNISCSVFPYFHVLMLFTSLLSFHLQSACTFSKSILRCIHKVVSVTVSYVVCVFLCPSVCTEQLDSHWEDFCEIWYWDVCIGSTRNHTWLKLGKNNHHFTWRPTLICILLNSS
jgi:hypothetical protein